MNSFDLKPPMFCFQCWVAPPASPVEVIEPVLFFCVSVNILQAEPFDIWTLKRFDPSETLRDLSQADVHGK